MLIRGFVDRGLSFTEPNWFPHVAEEHRAFASALLGTSP